MRKSALAVLFVGAFALSGCMTLDEFAVRDHDGMPRGYTGIGPLVSCDRPLNVVFVPGMGYVSDDPRAIIKGILRHNPDLVAKGDPIIRWIRDNGAELGTVRMTEYTADCSGGGTRELRTFFIDWTYSTWPKRKVVNAVDQKPIHVEHRLTLHNRLKHWFSNSVADMVLYAGEHRPTILSTVRAGFETIAKDYFNKKARNVVVAFSLGGSITFDVLEQMETAPEKNIRDFARDFRTNTTRFFMLSNQILLLRLSGAMQAAEEAVPSSDDDAALPCAVPLENYIKRRSDGPDAAAFVGEPWIIAFSDPNDLLSYPIPPDLCPEHSDVFLDVVTSVAREVLWVPGVGRLADPLKAHTGYGSDDRIIELIVEGYKP